MQYIEHGFAGRDIPSIDIVKGLYNTIEKEGKYKHIIDTSVLWKFDEVYDSNQYHRIYNPLEGQKKLMLLVHVMDPATYLDDNKDFDNKGWHGIDMLSDKTCMYNFWAEYWYDYWINNNEKFEIDVELQFDEHFKKYLMYNRKPVHHRRLAVDQLEKGNLLNDGYVTLADQLTLPMPEVKDIFLITDGDIVKKSDPSLGDMHIWNHSFVNVISETSMDGTFMSEKTFKPIVGKRPFISFNKERTQRLIDVGFKTFGNFWNENLDWYEQVDFICRQDVDTLKGWWESYEMQDILEHNKMHFWSTYQAINKSFLYDFLKK